MDALDCYEGVIETLPQAGQVEFERAVETRITELRQEGRPEIQNREHYDMGILTFCGIKGMRPIPRDTEVVDAIRKDYSDSTK